MKENGMVEIQRMASRYLPSSLTALNYSTLLCMPFALCICINREISSTVHKQGNKRQIQGCIQETYAWINEYN